ncbi:MAG: aminotransferase class I/II-fold pyridoxal phosphate-dependent enzyme [Oligoflexia bacterium]|nr:aminotransferase class I/II-fold pyridoxal phosphate-dependent enzyme [Oligoflexia bacterium]
MTISKQQHDPVQAIRDIQHFGEEGGVVPVIDVAATSTFMQPGDMEKAFHGEIHGCYLYSRHSNPSVVMFGQKLAALEGMEAAIGVGSGMAAVHSAITQLLPEGGHIICSRSVYGGTFALLNNILPRFGIQTTFVNMDDLAAVEKAITPRTKVLYTETMSNPMLRVADLPRLSALARKAGAKLVVDNTFTPLLVSPAKHGADVIIHSCTKYISGASDLIGGAIVSSREFIDSLIDLNNGMVMLAGPVMDSRVAHELYHRLDHLPIRMQAHSHAADFMARGMVEAGIPVTYPGLSSHPDHALLKSLMNPEFGFGGMMAVNLSDPVKAVELARRLQLEKFGLYAVSLGFSRTLMTCSAATTSSEIPPEEQKKMNLSPGLLRMSIGFTGNDRVMLQRFLSCYREIFG